MTRYLAIEVTKEGLAHAVLETSPEHLVSWRLSSARTDAAWRERLEKLIETYAPKVLVTGELSSRRSERSVRLLGYAPGIGLSKGVRSMCVGRCDVRNLFPEARSKHDIAVALVDRFPELAPRLPRPRKPWTSEDARMRIFDALSFILAADALPVSPPSHEKDQNLSG
jgi:hypothetical protein